MIHMFKTRQKPIRRSALQHKKGAALVEYGILVGLVSVVSISAVSTLFGTNNFFTQVSTMEIRERLFGLDNYLGNGDFDDTTGMTPQHYGFSQSSPVMNGWVSLNGLPFELHESGHMGMPSVNGGYWLDMGASPGNMDIEQTVSGLQNTRVYKITLYAGNRTSAMNNQAVVRWNGQIVGTIKPTVEDVMSPYTFNIRAGAGDGTNTVRITETGPNDSHGISLDQVRIFGY